MTFILWELAKNRHIQEKLRAEIKETLGRIRARGDNDFSVNDFDSMPYLLAVGKVCSKLVYSSRGADPDLHSPQETLRLYPIVIEIFRMLEKGDVLPLSKPITGVSGKVYEQLSIPAGTLVSVAVAGYNL